jgi:eukaryotic-like serine/threonine-protein kinase
MPDPEKPRETGRSDAEALSELRQLTARLPGVTAAESARGLVYGPYTLLQKIASGGMAEIFRARRTGVAGFEKIVAVKRILPHLSHDPSFVQRFVDEARVAAGLAHPNIVQIYDLGRVGASYYIAMEYVDGADLRTILRRLRDHAERFPIGLAVLVASRLAAALEHAHGKNGAEGQPLEIVHRDVSPPNVLISFEGSVKLTDFGIARAAIRVAVTEKGELRGKLMYMSPEQASGQRVDHRSDIFSLGVVLYELLTDQRPFFAGSDLSLLEAVRRGSFTPAAALLPAIPARLDAAVSWALRKEPAERPANAGELRRALEETLAELGSPGEPELAALLRRLFEREAAEALHVRHPDATLAPTVLTPAGLTEPCAEGAGSPPATTREPLTPERLLERFGRG